MIRSRSHTALLPITHAAAFPRPESRTSLGLRRGRAGGASLQRLVICVMAAALLAGSLYGVALLGRAGGGGGSAAEQHAVDPRQHHHRPQPHVHEGAADRHAAMEQRDVQAAAAAARVQRELEAQEQVALEQQHVERLKQQLQQQQAQAQQQHHDPQQQQGAAAELPAHVQEHIAAQQALPRRGGPSLYAANLSAVDIHGNIVRTADLAGKVTLIVNVASHCGYTEANYQGLHRLYERYKAYGLAVLAFPCNQFGLQEPGSHADIQRFVALHYGASFPLMSKVEVNGGAAHPIFAWLKQHMPGSLGEPHSGFQPGEDIRWNFEKFLLDKYGHPVKRYTSELPYHDLELDVYNELVKLYEPS